MKATRFALACAAALAAACADATDPNAFDPMAVRFDVATSDRFVSVDPAEATVAVGQTVALTATLHLYGIGYTLSPQYTVWASSDSTIATVSPSGVVTGRAAGRATISATHGTPGLATVTVTATATAPADTTTTPADTSRTTVPTATPAPSTGSSGTQVEQPRQYVDSRAVAPTGRAIRVPAGGDLQGALDAAQSGDEVLLAAGATYTGNFTLRPKSGSGWITVRTDAALPPEGVRVTPQSAAGFAKILSPNSMPAVETAIAAQRWRLAGLEIGVSPGVTMNYNVVALGGWGQRSLSDVPRDIILAGLYVHGTPTCDCKRGVELNGAGEALVDSYLTEFHSPWQDAQAVAGWNGPGPYKLVNNFLAASGENLMFGGAEPAISGVIPSDIEIRRNHFYKPLSWRGAWLVKNLLELKNAQRALVEGNVFENNWPDGQDGFSIVIKSAGDVSWTTLSDVTFRYNDLRNTYGGINIAKQAALDPQRVVIANNNFGVLPYRLWQLVGSMRDIAFEHNTGFPSAAALVIDGGSKPGVRVTDNLVTRGDWGIVATGYAPGTSSIVGTLPDAVVRGNVIIGAAAAQYPAGNFFPATTGAVGFVLFPSDPRLASGSPYVGQATDGGNPGTDWATLAAKTAGVTSAP